MPIAGYHRVEVTVTNELTAKGIRNGWISKGVQHVEIEPQNGLFLVSGIAPDRLVLPPQSELWIPGKR